jgi:HEPN domain-containing protein
MENQSEITLNQNNDSEINVDKIVNYWIEMSDNDFNSMIDFFNIKRYNWALFIGHLVIEKLIKASYVKIHQKHPPFLHDLLKLINKCNIKVSDEQMDIIDTITTFNINARYDDYKLAFYKQCTPEYTELWISQIKNIRQWIIDTQLK